MINSRNLEDLLQQSTRQVSTTTKKILASAVTLPNGSILCSYTTPQTIPTQLDNKKVKLISLFVYQQLLSFRIEAANSVNFRSDSNKSLNDGSINEGHGSLEGLLKFEKVDEEGLEIYVHDIPDTELKVVLITEKGYPDGVIKLKTEQLVENMKELEDFEYLDD